MSQKICDLPLGTFFRWVDGIGLKFVGMGSRYFVMDRPEKLLYSCSSVIARRYHCTYLPKEFY